MPEQLTPALKEARARALIALGNETALAYQREWLGQTVQVLLETPTPEGWNGFTPEYIQVTVPDCPACRPGAMVAVQLTALAPEGLRGNIVAEAVLP